MAHFFSFESSDFAFLIWAYILETEREKKSNLAPAFQKLDRRYPPDK